MAPPGSGKTIIGLEMARRLGRPALVLAPTAAIQGQWAEKAALFGPHVPLTALTYQALCRTDDPDGTLAAAAARRWAAEQAAATGESVAAVEAAAAGWTGAAAARRSRELARMVAAIKREIARGEHEHLALADLLAAPAVARVQELREGGVATVILDECHHLVSLWGYLVRAVLDELGEAHVIGLTATSPAEMTDIERELYEELLGPVDFETPTPAVVREGFLAPYQELALFTAPLDSELGWLRERHARFSALLDRLLETAPAGEEELGFGAWVSARMRYRGDLAGGAEIPFSELLRSRPALARAGVRYLHDAGLALPAGAPRGEGFREAPALEDWLVLLEDYALRCLRAHPGEGAARRLDDLAVGLADLGFTLTRTGIRSGRTDIDRVLVHSSAKPILACEALAAELHARAGDLHAVVLCDGERAPRAPEDSPLQLGGGGRGMLRAIGDDVRLAVTRPLLVSGETLACAIGDGPALLEALGRGPGLRVEEAEPGVGVVRGGSGWDSRAWVPTASQLLESGWSRVLIGTRALLGEGWDAPSVNCLVDLTEVAASISTRQMRGRSLRLDPEDPAKIASNWDIVCVAPGLERGTADYARFVRRHSHLHAPCEDGSIESGVSHVHPELSPYAPPPAEDFAELNAAALARAAQPDAARERWRIGEPYRAAELPVLLVRARPGTPPLLPGDSGRIHIAPGVSIRPKSPRGPGAGELHAETLGRVAPAGRPPRTRARASAAAVATAAAIATAFVSLPLAGALLIGAAATAAWTRRGATTAKTTFPAALPLHRVARALAEAYADLGEIGPTALDSLAWQQRAGGYVRCLLTEGTPDENARFAAALEDALSPASAHRYVLSRPVAPRRAAWHPVPADLGRNRTRAGAYHRAWVRWVGPSELRYTATDELGRAALAEAAAAPEAFEAQRRLLWT